MGEGPYQVKAKDLKIVWIDDNRYWRKPANESDDPAELLQVCWLEVTGSVPVKNPSKKHRITFEVSLTADAFGWSGTNLFIMGMKGNKGNRVWKKVNLMKARSNISPEEKFTIPAEGSLILDDKPAPDGDKNICFGLYEIWSGRWKGGLKIYKVTVQELDEKQN